MLSAPWAYAQPARIVKVLGDAVAREDRKPLAGKEWLLSVRVEDAAGNPLGREKVDFSIQAGQGRLRVFPFEEDATLWVSTQIETNDEGEADVLFQTDPSTAVLNSVSVRSVQDPSVSEVFTVLSDTLPVAVNVPEVLAPVMENLSKIQDMVAEAQITSDTPWLAAQATWRIKQKGERIKVEQISPQARTFALPPVQETPDPSAQTVEELVGIHSGRGEFVLRRRTRDQRVPYTDEVIRGDTGIVLQREEVHLVGDTLTRIVTTHSDFRQLPEAQRAWVFDKKVEKQYRGLGRLLFTTTTTVTSRQVNVGLTDAELEP